MITKVIFMKITIPGNPIPKARARVTRKGFAFDPQEKQKKQVCKILEQSVREYYEKNENRKEGYKLAHCKAFEVNWYFHMPIPKSFNLRKKNACKWGFIEHISKPDRSNLEKFYEDCANGILWKDDSQITKGNIIKKYCNDDKPRTEIIMNPIDEPNEEIKNIVSFFSPEDIYEICEEVNNLNKNLPIYTDNFKINSTNPLPKVASFLSKLADKHSDKLKKISKNHHGAWKKFESNSQLGHY